MSVVAVSTGPPHSVMNRCTLLYLCRKSVTEFVALPLLLMILVQQNKNRREPGEKCHARTMMHMYVYLQLNKKGRRPRVQECHAKTMLIDS